LALTHIGRDAAVAAFREGVGDRPSLSRVAVLVVLRIVERLVLAGALLVVLDDVARAFVIAALSGIVHLARGWVAASLRIRVRANVSRSAAAAVLMADPVRPLAAPGDDAFSTLVDGLEQSVRLIVDLLPGCLGDAIATVILVALLAARVRPTDVLVFTGAALVSAAVALTVRRTTARAGREAWRAQLPVWIQLRTIVAARDELVANGAEAAAEGELSGRLRAWATTEMRYQVLAGLNGRLALIWGAAVVVVGVAAQSRGLAGVEIWGRGVVLFAAAAPLVSFLAAVHEITKAQAGAASLVRVMALAREREKERLARQGETRRRSFPAHPLLVTARELTFRYPDASVDSTCASFTWTAGRLLAVTGPNGAGKSTLLKLLLRLAEPRSGSFQVEGDDASAFDPLEWRQGVAYVSQIPYIDEDATVRDFVRLLAPRALEADMQAALERLGVWSRLVLAPEPFDVRMRSLSSGQRQRVVIARAVVQDKAMVILDEPDASLDSEGIARLAALLRELSRDRLVAVVAHSSLLVESADDRVALGTVRS
jgi:ABC-type transport system involved in cytochrome bd biosynthesis fused ATPase/permease subunit